MEEYQISPRVKVQRGDAVKLATRRGLFRFVQTLGTGLTAEIVGPIGGSEVTRVVPAKDLRSAGRTPREEVAMSFEQRELIRRARDGRRR